MAIPLERIGGRGMFMAQSYLTVPISYYTRDTIRFFIFTLLHQKYSSSYPQ